MEGILREIPLIRYVVAAGALRDAPLTLLDVGCSGGLDEGWRDFEPDLVAHGVDPLPQEVERLRTLEQNPRVQYHCAFLALPPDHPFARLRGGRSWWDDTAWERTSTRAGVRLLAARNPEPTNDEVLAHCRYKEGAGIEGTPTLSPIQLLQQMQLPPIDFLKIDVDGADFDILVGFEDHLADVWGVGLEINYFGSERETDNTFHNVDRFMRRHGFALAHITRRSYSRAALPAPYEWPLVAQTTFGPPQQGDAIYIRDLLTPQNAGASVTQILKVACLYALCNLPDCAAELLLHFRDRLQGKIDVDHALDLLTPEMADGKVSYREYLARFENDMEGWFLPPYRRAPDVAPAPPRDGWRTGRTAGKLVLLASVAVFFVEAALQGGTWGAALFLTGLAVWAACWVLPRIPNKKQMARAVLRHVRKPAAAQGEAPAQRAA